MHNASRRWFLAATAVTLGTAWAAAGAQAQAVTVYAAASLQNVLDEAGKAYAARSQKQVRFSFGASSALARQIEQGAPAQIFISADKEWMDYVAQRRLIAPTSRIDLLSNRLALIAPAASKVRLSIGPNMPLLAALGQSGRLAVAAPEVPAGRYARAALASLGVLPAVESRLVPAENVRAAMNFVARGETPLGIVYDTDAMVEPRVKVVGLFPPTSHPKIVYPAALTAGATNGDAAFLNWLKGREAGAVFAKYGFSRP